MKQYIPLLILVQIFCLHISTALASITLNIPDDIRIVAINGDNTDSAESNTLPNGLNQIAVYFFDEVSQPFDEPEVEKSDVFVILFNAADTKLSLQKSEIKTRDQLEEFNRQPTFSLVDQNGKPVSFKIDKLVKEGFQLGRNYQQELMVFNASDSPAALSTPFQSSHKGINFQSAKITIKQPNSPDSSLAAEMLKYWYLQADETTRDQFRAWIEEK